MLGADASGDFTAIYNNNGTVLPALIDSGTDDYAFDDPSLAVRVSAMWVGYYCPLNAPIRRTVVNTGVGVNNASNSQTIAIADPNSFVVIAAAFGGLGGGGGSTNIRWGMPFFYGRIIYIGIEQRAAGTFTGPYYAY